MYVYIYIYMCIYVYVYIYNVWQQCTPHASCAKVHELQHECMS